MLPDFQSIQAIKSYVGGKPGERNPERLKKACQLFESMFINELFKEMRKTIPRGGLIKEGNRDRIYKSMLDQEYANRMAEAGGIGLGEMLFRQLSRNLIGSPEKISSQQTQSTISKGEIIKVTVNCADRKNIGS